MDAEPRPGIGPADASVGDPERSPWANARIGAVETAFIPFSPALDGVAGSVQQGGDRERLRVGAKAGLMAAAPIMPVFRLVFVAVFPGIVGSGGAAGPRYEVGILAVIALFVVGSTVVLGAVGGWSAPRWPTAGSERPAGADRARIGRVDGRPHTRTRRRSVNR